MLALQPGERWLVLGNMAELGAGAGDLHAKVGAAAREQGIARVYAVGALAARAAEAFGEGGSVHPDQPALIAALRGDLHAGVSVLIKGSHSSHMEKVVAALLEDGKGDDRDAA
jgi:UDP-N-acetylmuramoyl-tripeptide--D-alanyl-D-alanine ligase